MEPIIIIGTGLAGYTFAKAFRQIDTTTPLVMITEDDGAFYSKPLLSNVFHKNKTPQCLAVSDVNKMRTQLNATIHTHCSVTKIDTQAHTVTTESDTIRYSKLILANGAELIEPNIAGDTNQLWRVNNLMQYDDFYQAIANKNQLAIIGSGLIGCEFANDCCTGGKKVTIISADDYPLQQLIPKEMGDALQKKLEGAGIRFISNTLVTEVTAKPDCMSLSCNKGDKLDADLCLAAIGIRPRLHLAKQAGINTNKGVLVDTSLQTSAPDVYAVGDVIEFNNEVRAYIAPLLLQARLLAQHITQHEDAKPLAYATMPITVKTPLYPIACVPPKTQGRWDIDDNEQGMRARCFNENDELIGFALSQDRCKERMALAAEINVRAQY